MQIGSFMGGLADGFNTGNQMRDTWEKRQNRQFAKELAAKAQAEAEQDPGTVTDPSKTDYRVAGLGVTYGNEEDARSVADSQDFIDNKGAYAPGLDALTTYSGQHQTRLAAPPDPTNIYPADEQAMQQQQPLGLAHPISPDTMAKVQGATMQAPAPAPTAVDKVVTPGLTHALPKANWEDVFNKKYVPQITQRLMQQGRYDEATAYENMVSSREGKAYGKDFMDAITRAEVGDYKGAVPAIQRIFNRDIPNGQRALVIPDGENFRVRLIDEKTRAVLSDAKFSPRQLATIGVKHLMTPEGWMKYRMESAKSARDRVLDREDKAAQYAHELEKARISAGSKTPPHTTINIDGKDYLAERNPETGKWESTGHLAGSANGDMMRMMALGISQQNQALAQDRAARDRDADEVKRTKPYDEVRNILTGVARNPRVDPVTKQVIPGRFTYTRNGAPVSGDAAAEIDKAVASHIQLHGRSPWPSEQGR